LIDVEFQELPVVADPEQAASARGDAVLHPSLGDTNVISDRTYAFGPVDEDFSRADVIVKRRLRWHRSSAQPIETAGAVADYKRWLGAVHDLLQHFHVQPDFSVHMRWFAWRSSHAGQHDSLSGRREFRFQMVDT